MTIKCEECGAGYERIEVRDDKDNVIGYAAGKTLYAKEYVCKDCTNVWSENKKKSKEE